MVIFVAIAKNYIAWVKLFDFSLMPKIIRILNKIMFREYIFYISYHTYIKT